MKVIFLDFDGVINDIHDRKLINLLFVDNLKKLISMTSAKVVVTSSRRDKYLVNGLYEQSICYQEFIKPLFEMGIEVYGFTPFINGKQENVRELEIEAYLSEHEEIEEFVIIEDDYVMKHLYEHQVFIEYSDGFDYKYIEPAINILNGNLGFYPPNYDRSETFYERLVRLFPGLFEGKSLEEIETIINNELEDDKEKKL